ncbi:MAG: hypothetical protein JWP27_969 [Flaviaesturariibacter sp.]|nr:hypothetical protein [Flaviaesturariibacter sp.]
MKEQHVGNHTRIVPMYHILTGLALLALLIGSIRHLIVAGDTERYNASLIVLISLILLSLYIHARTFALKAQDRAIRAEESLRYYILTGKRLDARLGYGQVIALRFASDEELPALADRAVSEGMSSKDIKSAIKSWRADWHRV